MSGVKLLSLSCVLLGSFLAAFGQSSAVKVQKPLFIEDIKVTGTTSLDSARLNEIIGPLNQLKVRSEDEIEQRIRARFQEYGYFKAEVESVEAKPIDALEKVPRVHVLAEVSEGPRFRLGGIEFKNIRAIPADALRREFPIKAGDYFSRSKVASGIEAVRQAYMKLGYLQCTSVPDTTIGGDNKVLLTLDVDEGHEYRMASVLFAGNDDAAEKLRPRWELQAGQPFDDSYLDRFIKENESLFPVQFDRSRSISIARNCKDDTVTVFMELSPNHPSVVAPKDIGCDQESAGK